MTPSTLTSSDADSPLVGRFTPRQVRLQGGALIVLGGALAIGISVALASFERVAGNALPIGILVWALLLALMFLAIGVQQLKTGRRMKAVLYPAAVLLAASFLGLWFLRDHLLK